MRKSCFFHSGHDFGLQRQYNFVFLLQLSQCCGKVVDRCYTTLPRYARPTHTLVFSKSLICAKASSTLKFYRQESEALSTRSVANSIFHFSQVCAWICLQYMGPIHCEGTTSIGVYTEKGCQGRLEQYDRQASVTEMQRTSAENHCCDH